jgi:hypothetical protein
VAPSRRRSFQAIIRIYAPGKEKYLEKGSKPSQEGKIEGSSFLFQTVYTGFPAYGGETGKQDPRSKAELAPVT